MPDTLETDPNKGFIALPMSVFDLDLTPGAFRTLAELCRMANVDGQCWPSLAQLGNRLGRSRAAISGYIAELRAANLIKTETQKMANGYNYRLRYCVVFWKEWRKQLGQKNERRVQPNERPLRTKNHNHINQSPAPAVNSDLLVAWKKHVGRAPYPTFETWPSDALIDNTLVAAKPASKDISVDIIPCVTEFLAQKGICIDHLQADAEELLRKHVRSQDYLESFISELNAVWKPHWTKAPTAAQLVRLIKTLPPCNGTEAEAKLLTSYLKRWKTHSRTLSLAHPSAKVAA